ncbi:MAG: hypothetical protein ABR97_06725 [Rhodobacter sp. BACL10 MAG-120419-bin15]|nr:MAG: hypothetical protein ABR97_06725 [Rhodobacter sp. BACL10 MAG-120419-bin15]
MIADVTAGIECFAFNKAIAKLYELTNALQKSKASTQAKRATMLVMAQLMQPMVPHLAEEVWAMLGGQGLVTSAAWPQADPTLLVADTVVLPIQINGKRRAEITVGADMPTAQIEVMALADPTIVKILAGQAPKKVIVIAGRIINVVV